MQLDTTNRGFHPDDIERLCEERRKGAGISTRDFGVSHDFAKCRAASGWDRRFLLYPWPHTKRSGEVRGDDKR
jgi:hypothetical protein